MTGTTERPAERPADRLAPYSAAARLLPTLFAALLEAGEPSPRWLLLAAPGLAAAVVLPLAARYAGIGIDESSRSSTK